MKHYVTSYLKHHCGTALSIPEPLHAVIIPGSTITFVKAYCLGCKLPQVITLGEYYDAWKATKQSAPKVRKAGGA